MMRRYFPVIMGEVPHCGIHRFLCMNGDAKKYVLEFNTG